MSEQAELDCGEVSLSELMEHADVAVSSDKWPAALAEMVDVLANEFERDGEDREAATLRAQRVVLVLAEYQGGRPCYLPRGDRLRQALRDRLIYRLHSGDNGEALADRFGLTLRHIQRIYAEQRALHIRKRQARLFSDSADS